METTYLNKQFTSDRNRICLACWRAMGLWLLTALPASAADSSGAPTSDWSGRILDTMGSVMGDWVRGEAFAGGPWGQCLLAGGILLVVAIGVAGLRGILRRVTQSHAARAEKSPVQQAQSSTWIKLTLEALVPPLTLFIWIWGLYSAIALLLVGPTSEQSPFLIRLLGWLRNGGEVVALFWFIFRMIRVVEVRLNQWSKTTQSKWDDVIVALVVRALRLIIPLVGVILVVPTLGFSFASHELFKQAASLLLIGAVGFILYQLVNAVEDAVLRQFDVDVRDNLEARKVYTQVKVLKKIAVVTIVIFTAASMLMVFESVRQLGTSIMASAGVLGIIVGFAAQRSISTVLAGIQIALTQPIRLDDVVIVEGEWGRIEEINLTYVVVLIWDQRRLVVPISHFIEKPFQNWTRVSADLLGSVFLYVDYTVPLQALRDELDRLLEPSKRWDRKVKVIQVTDAKPNGIELRVLVSAADAPTAWDLRCELREKLIDFLQRNYPQSLPRVRAELLTAPGLANSEKPGEQMKLSPAGAGERSSNKT